MEILMLNMIKLLLLINFIRLFRNVFFNVKTKSSTLSCGITAFCGGKPADPGVIKLIMLYNESRGEDGTGWAVNNIVEKDTEKVSKFLQSHSLDISPNDDNFTIVAHDRKSSSGTKTNKELVHPFSIYADGVEKDLPDLILAMNGTLNNTEALSTVFEIPYKEYTNSDTQILAKAMAKLGGKDYVKVIEGYGGTATLVFFTPKQPNTLMVYRDPERPIYYWNKSPNEMYISSMEEPLLAAGAIKIDIKLFESEILHRIVKGKICKKEKIVRNPLKVKLKYQTNGYPANSRFRNQMYEGEYNTNTSLYYENSYSPVITTKEKKINSHSNRGSKIYCLTDRYYKNGHACQGLYSLNEQGEQFFGADITKNKAIDYYFVNGYMCKDEKSYNEIIEKCMDKSKSFDLRIMKSIILSSMVEYFTYPVTTIVESKEKWILNKEYSKKIKKKGDEIELDMVFSTNIIYLKYSGQLTATTEKDICSLVKVVEKSFNESSDLDKINNKISIESQGEALINFIKNDPLKVHRSNYLYSMMLTELYKVNSFQELRWQFYTILISKLFHYKVIDAKSFKEIKEQGGKSYNIQALLERIDALIPQLYVKLDSSSNEVIHLPVKVDGSNITTADRLKLLTLPNSTFTKDEIIKSIQKTNALFNREDFQNDVLDFDGTFEDLKITWIATDSRDYLSECYEAIALTLQKVGVITETQLIDILNDNFLSIETRVRSEWSEFMIQYQDRLKKENFHEEKPPNLNLEDSVDDDPIDETITPEDFEEDCKNNLKDFLDSGLIITREIETVRIEDRTEHVQSILTELTSAIRFLKKQLIKNEKNKS